MNNGVPIPLPILAHSKRRAYASRRSLTVRFVAKAHFLLVISAIGPVKVDHTVSPPSLSSAPKQAMMYVRFGTGEVARPGALARSARQQRSSARRTAIIAVAWS